MSRVLFYPRGVRIALIAITTALFGCSAVVSPSPTLTMTSTVRPTAVATANVTASPTPSPTPVVPVTPTPAPTPAPIRDLADVFHPLVSGWRPTVPTLLYSTGAQSASRFVLVAQPLAGGPATEVVDFAGDPAIRPDGGALAVTAWTPGGPRIATLDLRTGATRWITAATAGGYSAIWSRDGASLFYMATAFTPSASEGAVHRVQADGTGDVVIAKLDRAGDLRGLTPDGGRLIWSRGQAGGSVDVLDLATGADRDLVDNANVASMRAQQPRLLLSVGGCCAGPGGGALVLWDDLAVTSREIAPVGRYAYGAAAWDPTGTRIAAVRMDAQAGFATDLVTIDPATGASVVVPDTHDALFVLWIDEGMLVSVAPRRGPTLEVKLLPAQGGAARQFDKRTDLWRAVIIRP